MKVLAILTLSLAALFPAVAETVCAVPTNAPARIVLRDQFDAAQSLHFPTTNVTLLTIADKKGSEQIAGWVAPIKERYDNRVAICGIADVSAVPRPLRGLVRRKFQSAQKFPVMLDWSGDVAQAFGCVGDHANVFVLDGTGRILARAVGPATEAHLRDIIAALDAALSDRERNR